MALWGRWVLCQKSKIRQEGFHLRVLHPQGHQLSWSVSWKLQPDPEPEALTTY